MDGWREDSVARRRKGSAFLITGGGGVKICMYLGTVYLSPPNYERNNNDDLISEIEAEMLSFSQKGGIIVQGDYNARTGDIQEVVLNYDKRG